MSTIRCDHCSATINTPEGYSAPFIKCENCGAHHKNPALADEPVYKLLTPAARARSLEPVDLSALPTPEESAPKRQKWRQVIEPVITPADRREAAVKLAHKPIKLDRSLADERVLLKEALGTHGMELLMQLTASYMGEVNEKARAKAKAKALQSFMRTRVSAGLANRAMAYAEKSEEINDILWENYRSNLLMGLGIFAVGLAISLLVYLLAHPGRGFVLFQIPFAVGIAYAVNAGIHMIGLKVPALRNETFHYGFIAAATLLILAYVASGLLL